MTALETVDLPFLTEIIVHTGIACCKGESQPLILHDS